MHALAPRPRTAGPQAGQPAADGKLVPGGARVELRVPLLPPPGGRSPLSGPSRGARSCRLRDIGRPVERGRDGGPAGQRRRRHSARSVCPCRGIRRFRFVPCAGRAGAAGPAWRPLAQARAALDANHAGLDAAKAESARPRWRSARPMRWGAGSSSWPAAGCTTRRTCEATTGRLLTRPARLLGRVAHHDPALVLARSTRSTVEPRCPAPAPATRWPGRVAAATRPGPTAFSSQCVLPCRGIPAIPVRHDSRIGVRRVFLDSAVGERLRPLGLLPHGIRAAGKI